MSYELQLKGLFFYKSAYYFKLPCSKEGEEKKKNPKPTNPENFEDSQDFSGKASLTNCLALVTFGHEADGTFHFGSLYIFLV